MPTDAHVFRKYLNGVFVETGSAHGGGISQALIAGFSKVISIELSPVLFQHCTILFAKQPKVQTVFGDSAVVLGKAIAEIKEPITFWLDGHFSGGETAFGIKGAPILEELEHIRKHPLAAQHTILIDDRRMLKKTGNHGKDTFFELTELEVVAKLKEINPNYIISYEDGFVPNDVIVARPPPQAKISAAGVAAASPVKAATAKATATTAAAPKQI